MIVGTKDGIDYINAPQITLAINEWNGTRILLKADTIDIQGLVNELTAYDLTVVSVETTGTATFGGDVYAPGLTITDGGQIDGASYISADDANFDSLTIDGNAVSWESFTYRHCTLSNSHYYLYSGSSGSTVPSGTASGRIVTSYEDTTIHYLGY